VYFTHSSSAINLPILTHCKIIRYERTDASDNNGVIAVTDVR
jgi:hypothetical protein